MKLAVVVQRYGADINGGAELHARYIAERLARHASVEVMTTCARDYVTWKNELPAGDEQVNGITVRRFPVAHERKPDEFGRRSIQVFDKRHSLADELRWLDSEGPASPALVRHVEAAAAASTSSSSSAIATTTPGISRAASREGGHRPDRGARSGDRLSMFGPVFRGVRGLMTTRRKSAR